MPNKKYLEEVSLLLKKQKENKWCDLTKEIEKLKEVKPVCLGLMLAEYINERNKKQSPEDIIDFEKRFSIFYNYPHMMDFLEALESMYLEKERSADVERIQFTQKYLKGDIESYLGEYTYLDTLCFEHMSKEVNNCEKILDQLYKLEDVVGLVIFQKLIGTLKNRNSSIEWIYKEINMGYLMEELLEEMAAPFVFIASLENCNFLTLLAKELSKCGKKVFLFREPLIYESDNIKIEDTVLISIENMQQEGNLTTIFPVQVVSSTNGVSDSVGYLLEYINRHCNCNGMLNIIGEGYLIDEISTRDYTNHKMVRLSQYYYEKREKNLALARYGDYMKYISKIYKTDCWSLLNQKTTKRFSIVIPARNSVETLKYTILTCLEQTYKGDYEILISDNSTTSTKVYELCVELNDPRIRYIKTPRDLPLARSFEYAYLNALGEYVFSLGADDGILPWALEIADGIFKANPNEPILQWKRGFYAWPGFNDGQQHQFVLPYKLKKEEYRQLYYKKGEDYLKEVFENPLSMYSLPLLYINSCFKKNTLQIILEKTGSLLDGPNQDISTGITIVGIFSRILNTVVPLSIAGMSSKSVGATFGRSNNQKLLKKELDEINILGNVGGYSRSRYEHFMPQVASDVAGLYLSILRAVSNGTLSKEYIMENINLKTAFLNIINRLSVDNITYFENIYKIKYIARIQGQEFANWFNNEIFNKCMIPKTIDIELMQALKKKQSYVCEVNSSGGMTLNASEYGVQNIYDAVQLFTRLFCEEQNLKSYLINKV